MTIPWPDPSRYPGATLLINGAEYKSDGTEWVHVRNLAPGSNQVDTTRTMTNGTLTITFNGKLLPAPKFIKYDLVAPQEDAVCECGAGKVGIENYARGHSDWCPVNGES